MTIAYKTMAKPKPKKNQKLGTKADVSNDSVKVTFIVQGKEYSTRVLLITGEDNHQVHPLIGWKNAIRAVQGVLLPQIEADRPKEEVVEPKEK
jgi:hypothetical protein